MKDTITSFIAIRFKPVTSTPYIIKYAKNITKLYIQYMDMKFVNENYEKYYSEEKIEDKYIISSAKNFLRYLDTINNINIETEISRINNYITSFFGEWKLDICYLGNNDFEKTTELFDRFCAIVISNLVSDNVFKIGNDTTTFLNTVILKNNNWNKIFEDLIKNDIYIPDPNILHFLTNCDIVDITRMSYDMLSDLFKRTQFNVPKIPKIDIKMNIISNKLLSLVKKFGVHFEVAEILLLDYNSGNIIKRYN